MTQKAAAQTTQAVKAPAAMPQLMLQRAAVSDAPVPDVPAVVRDVLRAPGRPLDAATRAYMEPRFGHDFSGVRVHTDDRAAESARAVNALAYTVGRDVVFGAGRYQPQGEEGRRLIAHELTHTLQQRDAANSATPLEVARPEAASERSAEAAARSVARGGPVQPQAPEPRRVARQAAPTDAAKPKKIGKIVRIQINLTTSEATFQSASGETLHGTVDTDLEAGGYTLIPDVAAKHWGILGAKPGLRFDLELEEADPWKLNYPPRLALEVVSGSKEDVSLGKTLDAADAEQTQGDPQEMPGYIQNAVKSVNIPIWGGPFYLYDKPVAYGTTPAKVVMPRSEFSLDDDPLKGGPVEIRLVYKSRALADAAVSAMGVKNAYAFYEGASGLIYPTLISDTSAPALCAALRTAVKNERADAKAASKLGVDLALWYVGARYSAKVTEGGPAPKAGAAAVVTFDAGKVAEELVAAAKPLGNPGKIMLETTKQLARMADLAPTQKVNVILEIFSRIGFGISKEGVKDMGEFLIMHSEDSRYAFKVLKASGEILYGKFDMTKLEYLWTIL